MLKAYISRTQPSLLLASGVASMCAASRSQSGVTFSQSAARIKTGAGPEGGTCVKLPRSSGNMDRITFLMTAAGKKHEHGA
jgi:hypothetical protein